MLLTTFLRSRLFVFLLIAAVAWLAYGGVTSLPLYMDDVIFGRYIEGVTLGELFTRIDLVPYYRPLSNAPWKLIMLANNGAYDPAGFHRLNLIFHILNGWLVRLLADKMIAREAQAAWQRNIVAGLAALLYVLFPFSYQAVGWAAALGHVMATFGALLAANAVLAWRQGDKGEKSGEADGRPIGGHYSVLMIWVGSAIAIFSHENGAATPFLVVMVFVLGSRFSVLSSGFGVLSSMFTVRRSNAGMKATKNPEPRTQNGEVRTLFVLLVPFLILALYVAVWWVLPKARPNGIAVSPADWIANAAYFAQGIGYPLAQVGAWTWKTFGLPREVVAAALGVIGGLAALLLAGKAGRVGVAWYVIAISVPTLLLQRAYAIDGPRLMMLASPGAALLWAAVVGRLAGWGEKKEFNTKAQRYRVAEGGDKRERAWLARGLSVALAVVMVVSSGVFVGQRMGLHRTMSETYWQMFGWSGLREGNVFVNLPAWMAYRDEWYALGSEGITYMTDYIGLRDLVYVNTGEWREVEYASYPAAFPDLPQYWWDALRVDRSAEAITEQVRALGRGYVTTFTDGGWVWNNALPASLNDDRVQNHHFVNGLTLEEAGIGTNKNEMFEQTPEYYVTLTWRAQSPIEPVSAFVHIVCDGEVVAQADGAPLRGIVAFSSFAVGETWSESRVISLRGGLADCVMRVGLYDPNTGERIALEDGGEYAEIGIR